MCALSVQSGTLLIIGINLPDLLQLVVHHIVCTYYGTCIIPSSKNRARRLAVQICHTCQETVYTVSVVISPCSHISSARIVIDRVKRLSGLTVKQSQILRSVQDISIPLISQTRGRCLAYYRTVVNHLFCPIDRIAFSIYCTVCGLADHFRFAIAVEIIHLELCIVRAGTDIDAEVDPPQQSSVKFVAVDIYR